jgi:RNA polymerase sigma-70 factor (ECF subfamily)
MIKLEGRIAGPWAQELHRTWVSLVPSLGSKRVCLDICEVTFVDTPGKQLLIDMRKSAVGFLADTGMNKYLVEEIERAQGISDRRGKSMSMSADSGVKQAKVATAFKNASNQALERSRKNGSQLKNGGGDFAALLDRCAGIVYWLACYITEDNEDAEDVLQQTFLKADSDFTKSQRIEFSVAWLLEIAVSESFAKVRTRNSSKLLRLSLAAKANTAFVPQEIVEWSEDIEKRYTSEELRTIVHEGIRSLTTFSRIVFLLRDVAKLRTGEIADLLHVSVPSVKSHLLRSRLQLREHLNKYFKPTFKEATQTG